MPSRSEELLQEQMQETDNPTVPGASATYGLSAMPTGVVARRGQMQIPPDAIVKRDDGSFGYKRFTWSATGMDMPPGVTPDEWSEIGYVIRALDTSISWAIGDWAAWANAEWKIPYLAIAEEYGYEEDTIKTYASVCRAIKRLIRNRPLSFSHHREVAPFDSSPGLQERWLVYTATRALKLKEMKREMRFLELHSIEDQEQWLDYALSQPVEYLLSQEERLQRPALLPPQHLPSDVVDRREDIVKAMNKLSNFVQGKRFLSSRQLEQEGRAVIEWIERVIQAGGE